MDRIFTREQFNAPLTEVTWTAADQPDGSSHVGYTDENGQNHDITAAMSSGGFSAQTPVDSSPVFNPDNGEVHFLHGVQAIPGYSHRYQVFDYDPSTGGVLVIGQPLNTSDSLDGNGPTTITVQHGVVVLGDLLLSPNGKLAAEGAPGFVETTRVKGRVVSAADTGSTDPPGSYLGQGLGAPDNAMTVEGWVSNTAAAVTINQQNDIYSFSLFPTGVHVVKPVDLLPGNESSNGSAVISPDHTHMAFEATKADTSTLYNAAISGTSASANVTPIPTASTGPCWRGSEHPRSLRARDRGQVYGCTYPDGM